MSHRVTTKTQIQDKAIACKALAAAGWTYRDEGSSLKITSGPMSTAVINLETGDVIGDTDRHSKDTLGLLRQGYAEAKYVQEVIKAGGQVLSRNVVKEDVVLRVSVNFG